MGTFLRRVVFFSVLFALLLGAALLSIRSYGEHRLEQLKAEFVATVAPLPEAHASRDLWQQEAQRAADEALPIFRQARDEGDAALAALAAGETGIALDRLGRLAEIRDEMLGRHHLVHQIVGVALGQKALEVADAILDRHAMDREAADPAIVESLASYFREPSLEGWRQMLAYETAQTLGTPEVDGAGRFDRLYAQFARPFEDSATVSLYLAMHEALVEDSDDVGGQLYAAVEDSRPLVWPTTVAEILVPNLISMVEKRQAYVEDLDRLRARLARPTATSI